MKKENKKAQLKIQEMAFVLLAVVFLFAILLLFFARFQMSSLQKSATAIREERTTDMLRTIASMPELSCSGEANCIDEDKLKAFELSTTKSRYSELWQESKITKVTVEQVYPKTSKIYSIYETPAESTVAYSTFIPLCIQNIKPSCKIAKIKVTVEVPK